MADRYGRGSPGQRRNPKKEVNLKAKLNLLNHPASEKEGEDDGQQRVEKKTRHRPLVHRFQPIPEKGEAGSTNYSVVPR